MQQTITPESYKKTWSMQTGNLFAADLVGMAAEGLFIANIDKFDKAFPVISTSIINTLNIPMYYVQRPVEAMLNLTKNFEGKDYFEQRVKKTEHERIETLSKALYHYGTALAVGWGTMFRAERAISSWNKTPPIHSSFFMRDAMIHTGLIAVMALPQMEGATQQLKDTIKCVCKGFGADENKSEDFARISTFSFIPNLTTLGIVSGLMHRDLRLKSLQQSLNSASSLVPHI